MNTCSGNTILAAAAALLLSLSSAHAGDSFQAALRYLPASTNSVLVATVNVRKVVDSTLVEKVAGAVLDEGATRTLPNLAKAAGVDLKKDFERLTVYGAFKPGVKRPERGVAVFQGQLDPERICALLRMNPQYDISRMGDLEVHSWTDKGDSTKKYASFVEKGLLVIAVDQASMEAALEAVRDKSKSLAGSPDGELLTRGAADPVFWARVILPAGSVELGDPFGLNRVKDLVVSADMDESSLSLRVQVRSDSAELRNDVADILRGILAVGRLQQANAKVSEVARGTSVSVENDTVRLDLAVPADKLIEILKAGKAQKRKG